MLPSFILNSCILDLVFVINTRRRCVHFLYFRLGCRNGSVNFLSCRLSKIIGWCYELISKFMLRPVLLIGVIVIMSVNLSFNFVQRAFCDDWWDQFQDAWDQAEEWFDEKKDEASDWWDEAKEWAKEKSKEAEDWWERAKERGEEYWQEAKEWGEETKEKVEQFAKEFSQEVKDNFESAVEKAKQMTGPYRREAFKILEQEARRQLCQEYSDPEKVSELERKRNLLTEAAIAAVKLVPVYDSESGQVHTFDQFARDLYSDIPGIEGSDLAEDPVRCVALMVLDSDYLMYARIIRAPNGEWISISEALAVGYKVNQVTSAVSDYNLAREGFRTNDSTKIENGMMSFASRIRAINESSQTSMIGFDPMLLAPFGFIGMAAGLFLKWDSRRRMGLKS